MFEFVVFLVFRNCKLTQFEYLCFYWQFRCRSEQQFRRVVVALSRQDIDEDKVAFDFIIYFINLNSPHFVIDIATGQVVKNYIIIIKI